ncbi:MAG TPA: MarR family transcriptional regulator [Ramlibacter sp.]|nr:MarR family transcriptional regulator [Ramlibacter sp.]
MYEPPSKEFPRRFPFFWIVRVHNAYILEMERALKTVDLDVPTWRALGLLREHGPLSVSELARESVIKLSTVTRTIYRMKSDGLVDTTVSPEDARVTVVTPTAAGLAALERSDPLVQHLFDRCFDGLAPSQVARANEVLAQVLSNLSPRYSKSELPPLATAPSAPKRKSA